MATLADPDIRRFLGFGARTGKLGFVAADGQPLVAPVWFVLNEEKIVFDTAVFPASSWFEYSRPR